MSVRMECFTWASVFVILNCVIIHGLPNTFQHTGGCLKCKPGYFAVSPCDKTRNTVCRRCPSGHFTTEWNSLSECYPCSKCGIGLYELKQCTRTADVFCESCSSGESRGSSGYLQECLGLDEEAARLLSDEPRPGNEDGSNIFETLDTSDLKLKEDDDEINKDGDDSSGEVVLFDDAKKEKVTKLNESPDTQDISDIELIEGSGYVLTEEGIEDDELSELLAKAATVEPSDAREDELLPVGKTLTTEPPYDVVELDLEEAGSGLVIEEMTNVNLTETVTRAPGLTEETSQVLVDINFSGDGDKLPSDNASLSQDIVVLTKYQPATTTPLENNDSNEEEIQEIEMIVPEENAVEASTDEEVVAEGGMDGKTRTAVIVGVAAGAVIFFALGFFASRQCKKRHSFKSMKKVESPEPKANGSPEEVHFRGGRNSGKYDPGAYERHSPTSPKTESVVLLSTKSLTPENTATPNLDKHVNGIDKIRYMDETTDDEAETATPRDRLIKHEEENAKGSNSLSSEVMNKLEDKLAPIEEELHPMLPKETDSKVDTS